MKQNLFSSSEENEFFFSNTIVHTQSDFRLVKFLLKKESTQLPVITAEILQVKLQLCTNY
jgi:hypothetical protein